MTPPTLHRSLSSDRLTNYETGASSVGSVGSTVRELLTFVSTMCSRTVAATSEDVCSSIARVSAFAGPVNFSGASHLSPVSGARNAGIIGDHNRALHRFETLAALADIVKLSDEDAAWLYPDTTTDEIPNKIIALGPSLVVVTAGSRGATLTSPRTSLHMPGAEVTVADTIGAGDTFMGALLHHLLEAGISRSELGGGLDEGSLRLLGLYAVRAAGINVSRYGADPPFITEMRRIDGYQGHI